VAQICECSKVQTAHHIMHNCTKFKLPCLIYEMDNPILLEYLVKSQSSYQRVPICSVYKGSKVSNDLLDKNCSENEHATYKFKNIL